MSIALLTAERCSANVATPSATVNDKELIPLPPSRLPAKPLHLHLTYLVKRPNRLTLLTIMPPTNLRRKVPLRPAGRYPNIRRRSCDARSRSLNMSTPCGGKPAPFKRRSAVLLLIAFAVPAMSDQVLPNESPADFSPKVESFDYTQREVMIPMRDGVKLQTVILIPRGAQRAPILLTRTAYGASTRITKNASAHLAALIDSTDAADDAVLSGGYIRVVQDVRGKHGSEGDYIMTRPLQGPLNPTGIDHSTDTYDTIDWLVKNIPETHGKVGILGISYDGFTSRMALVTRTPRCARRFQSTQWSMAGWAMTGFTRAHFGRIL